MSVNLTKKLLPQQKEILLTVIIPAYNVSEYIEACVKSMIFHKNEDKIEILIVNDGSKDNTKELVKKLIFDYCDEVRPIIRLIDKENGGHGSTINVGVREAKGKYLKVVDGDDWLDTPAFKKLIDILDKETADIILNDYCEDRTDFGALAEKKLYSFMTAGIHYEVDDLCMSDDSFGEWGPILATSTYKTQMLKDANFELSEKCYYVDMEFNSFIIANADTVVYYPLDIYRYFIGREGQSISEGSYKRNVKDHEKVLLRLINISEDGKMSAQKKKYIFEKLILPMYNAHHIILIDYLRKRKHLAAFNKKIKEFSNLFENVTMTRRFRLHIKTNGLLMPFDKILVKLFSKK